MLGVLWAVGAVLVVELTRDAWHWLSHVWPWLYRHHVWHHRVFRRDLSVANIEVYRKAQFYNDVPECGVMLVVAIAMWQLSLLSHLPGAAAASLGILYSLGFMLAAIARGLGWPGARELTDVTHKQGAFTEPPSAWFVNRTYHWRHHFDNDKAYYCSTFTLLDGLMGTALSLKGKTVAVTGASGTMGRALLGQLQQAGAKVVAFTSGAHDIAIEVDGAAVAIPTRQWSVERVEAADLSGIDILIINHGVNVYGARTTEAIQHSLAVNTTSALALLDAFLATVHTDSDRARKEVWVNTSEAEVSPAFSPLYEISKRLLGKLITLRRLDAPCTVRKIILGPFKSELNPYGVMSAERVAAVIVRKAQSGQQNIIVTINPLTWVIWPLHELLTSLYFRWFSKATTPVSEAESVIG